MKIAYFDCFAGAGGDMILSSLLSAGLDPKWFKSELKKLNLSGYKLKVKEKEGQFIAGLQLSIKPEKRQPQRSFNQIRHMIESSKLPDSIKALSIKIFEDLAEVEAKIHQQDPEEIHFHEIGAVDSIIDIVGTVICLKQLGIEKVYASKMHLGTGMIECQHGILPVPAPATLELLKGIPVYSTGIPTELTTPTAAAIFKNICKNFGSMPEMTVQQIGYGIGTKELKIPNLLRLYIGETRAEEYEEDSVYLVQSNIDDMNPEFFSYVEEKLKEEGALDVYLTPVYMKKNRPGTLLSVLTSQALLDPLIEIVFQETTTIGVRIQQVKRKTLNRETIKVKTAYGKIKVKVSRMNNQIMNIAPEYDSCKKVAKRKEISIKEVYEEAQKVSREYLQEAQSAEEEVK